MQVHMDVNTCQLIKAKSYYLCKIVRESVVMFFSSKLANRGKQVVGLPGAGM